MPNSEMPNSELPKSELPKSELPQSIICSTTIIHTSHRPATYLHLPSLRQAQLNNYTIPTIWIWVMKHPLLFGDQFSTATKIPTTSHYSLHPDHDLRILWPQLPTTKMPIPPRWSGRQNYCPCVFGGSRLSPLRLLYNHRRHQWHKICHLICEDPTTAILRTTRCKREILLAYDGCLIYDGLDVLGSLKAPLSLLYL